MYARINEEERAFYEQERLNDEMGSDTPDTEERNRDYLSSEDDESNDEENDMDE